MESSCPLWCINDHESPVAGDHEHYSSGQKFPILQRRAQRIPDSRQLTHTSEATTLSLMTHSSGPDQISWITLGIDSEPVTEITIDRTSALRLFIALQQELRLTSDGSLVEALLHTHLDGLTQQAQQSATPAEPQAPQPEDS